MTQRRKLALLLPAHNEELIISYTIASAITSGVRSRDFYVDLNNIHVKTVTSTTTQTDIRQWLDYAKSNKLWLVLLYHRIDEAGDYSTNLEGFSKHIKAVKDSGIRVLPVRSALKELGKL